MHLIKAAHDRGNYRAYHSMFKIIGQTLYTRGLPHEQQSIVDEAQSKVTINYVQSDEPVKAVLDIVKVVAVDQSIAKVTRLISSFNRVTSCCRSNTE